MNERTTITDSDIQAYIDNQLDPARCREIEIYSQNHPEIAGMIEDFQILNHSIKALYNPILEEELPKQFTQGRKIVQEPKQPKLFKIAASLAWLAIGGIIGWSLHPTQLMLAQSIDGQETHLVQPASFAHAIYSTETLHPVEVSAQQQQHLVSWLSKRLHTDIKAPDLSKNNYQLVGGRLLPSTNRMAAQFMYQDQENGRITLYIRRGAWNNNKTVFHFSSQEDSSVLYWISGEMGYALVGNLKKAELLELSEQIFQQI